jgi:mannose-6-phosphate isomerase-like protein (cupin superfamily)
MSKPKPRELATITVAPTYSSETFHGCPEVKKLWGSEFLIHNSEKYCCKVMRVIPGGKCSVHWHKKKEETFTLCQGKLLVAITNIKTGESRELLLKEPGESITIEAGTPHTFYLLEGSEEVAWFVESSSQDFADDSYRATQSTGPITDIW